MYIFLRVVSQAAAANFNQANSGYRPPMVSNQIRPPGFPPVQNPHANSQNNFNRGNNFNQNRGNNFNQASTSGSGTLPGNTVTTLKMILNSTEDVQPPVVQIQTRNPNPEPNVAPVDTPVPKASIPFPSRRNDGNIKKRKKANDQFEKFMIIFRDLSFEIALPIAFDAHAS
ncbi:hypothetical protein Tco_0468252 [Tanacetum coccineum]|uniref:Reverse transcriptase domain-containing protein n=1 Tax=Tanacetum coccineum TaxID=301880 RepID=A0ABQ5H463_9ASTR